uniref:Preprotein-translocase subunit g n=1 Tax=Polysiphonia sp. TaxID=1967842 RepID=A0A1Z1MTD0_9FLOR|nr:preprotein-translocase subunit g [Polysiphonia sp.]
MLVKLLWYFFMFLIIVFILINVPSNNSVGTSLSDSYLFNIKSNKLFMNRIISLSVLSFFILTILSLF